MKYVVMCERTGGVTGYACVPLRERGEVLYFINRTSAGARAQRLNALMNRPEASATYRYWVEEAS
jgi:hypothetical protein